MNRREVPSAASPKPTEPISGTVEAVVLAASARAPTASTTESFPQPV
jgi:hypothetical protein